MSDTNNKIIRKFKNIDKEQILDIEKHGIIPLGVDEIFVLIENSNTHYISNYGRCVSLIGRAKLLDGGMRSGKLAYAVYVWENGERISKAINADKLVIDHFYDYNKEYSRVWHSGNDVEDNYYKNLYPMNNKEFDSVKRFYDAGGFDSEEKIMELLEGEAYNIPSVLGVGYWGMPDVDVHHWTYIRWNDMLMRCYSDKFQARQPNYIGDTVEAEWLCYANFKPWAEENYYVIDGEPVELDKDILVPGNTVYSKHTCIFAPKTINQFVSGKTKKGNLPIGVDFVANKYRVRVSIDKKQKTIGVYDTAEEAFKKYKEVKEELVKELAERYKGKIPDKLYDALLKWEVKIGD